MKSREGSPQAEKITKPLCEFSNSFFTDFIDLIAYYLGPVPPSFIAHPRKMEKRKIKNINISMIVFIFYLSHRLLYKL